jgi:hypothetical protein
MKTKQPWLMIIIIVLGLLLSGCGLNLAPTTDTVQLTLAMLYAQSTLTKIAVDTQIALVLTPAADTSMPPTNTSQPEPTATNTSLPTATNTLLPTLTPLPSATNTSPAPVVPETRLDFEINATNVSVMGMVTAYTTQRYVFRAFSGQLVDITLTSGQECAISVSGRDGTVLLSPMGESQSFRGYLPSTQDWFIDIRAAGSNANFGLYLMIPERINFASGAHEITLTSYVPAGGRHNYIAYALAGQQMSVSVTPGGNLALSVWGIDGTVLMSGMGESNTFIGTLPVSQDWIINVRSAPGVGNRNYTFWMDIQ